MSKYFDKDFWRFLMGFIAIICTSLIILLASRMYQERELFDGNDNSATVINSLKNNN